MTIPVFPTLPGKGWPVGRSNVWSTIVQKSQSGKKSAIQLYTWPEYQYSLSFRPLRTAAATPEYQTLLGFVNSLAGQGSVFYFTDPDDSVATAQGFGTGDGATTAFQLGRTLGGYWEPIQSPNTITAIDVAGTPTAAYTLGAKGVVTFTSAPTAGAALTWTGTYYWLCRLDADNSDFSKIVQGRYELKKLSFTTEKL